MGQKTFARSFGEADQPILIVFSQLS